MTDNTPPTPTPELPPLPTAAAAYMQGCNQYLSEGELLYTADQVIEYTRAAIAAVSAAPVPAVTDSMVDAYLQANKAYWRATDELPRALNKWRTGTPREATRQGLLAAIASGAAAPQEPDYRNANPIGLTPRQKEIQSRQFMEAQSPTPSTKDTAPSIVEWICEDDKKPYGPQCCNRTVTKRCEGCPYADQDDK